VDDRAGPPPRPGITNGQGFQVGDGNIQVNLFAAGRPAGPAVAGNVPQAPAAFQPREDLMARLRAAGPGVSVIRPLTGMRGVGKSQLAAAYARECRAAGWRLVGWVDAADTAAVLSGLSVVADRLGIDQAGKSLALVGLDVRNRLEADGERCLIVFDNVADPDVLLSYAPSIGDCQVVVTSTEAAVAVGGTAVRVDVFSEQEALAYLASRTGQADAAGARTLAAELGFLPLALAQAAAVIAGQRLTFAEYLDRLRGYPAGQYLPRAKGDPYQRGVTEAILLSVDAVTAADPTGVCDTLLSVVSLLAPDGVPVHLLRYSGEWSPARAALPADPASRRGARTMTNPWAYRASSRFIESALGALADASLITFSADGTAVLVHRLVARTVRERLDRERRLAEAGVIARDLLLSYEWIVKRRKAFSSAPASDRAAERDFARQAAALAASLAPPGRLSGRTRAWRALRSWAEAYDVLGESPPDAIARAAKRVSDRVRAHGEQHAATLDARSSLAEAYLESGQRDEAIEQLELVYHGTAQAPGKTTAKRAEAAGRLAVLYLDTGRASEAGPPLTLALRWQRAAGLLGASDPDIVLRSRYETAELAAERIPGLEVWVSVYPPLAGGADLHSIQYRINLAAAYRTVGRADEAIEHYQRALFGLEARWGPEDQTVMELRGLLDTARREAGQVGEAGGQEREAGEDGGPSPH
jgi:tetratricopeptide (TPR) repeat protein